MRESGGWRQNIAMERAPEGAALGKVSTIIGIRSVYELSSTSMSFELDRLSPVYTSEHQHKPKANPHPLTL